ncbi:MAG: hypothetical protein K5657_06905 [Desulfovibrio sp.]|nr:hypothetical protein [Desulfovibrio sp.]
MMQLLTGPLFVASLLIFVIGLVVRAVLYIKGLDAKLERVAYSYHRERSVPGAAMSIIKWLIPAGTAGWRTQPVAMVLFFLLHFGAVLLPLFLLGHTVILEQCTGISLPALPNNVADILTIASLSALALLALRRILSPVLRQLNSFQDWLILALTFAPFFTGFMAMHSASSYDLWIQLHVISGELFLVLAPFTKLSHIVLFFMSRAQLGIDFAIKRGGDTRGGVFPW